MTHPNKPLPKVERQYTDRFPMDLIGEAILQYWASGDFKGLFDQAVTEDDADAKHRQAMHRDILELFRKDLECFANQNELLEAIGKAFLEWYHRTQ